MNVDELKAEAAKLPPVDRVALAEWLAGNEDIRDLRRLALVREIQVGLDEFGPRGVRRVSGRGGVGCVL